MLSKLIQFVLYFLVYFLLTLKGKQVDMPEVYAGLVIALIFVFMFPFRIQTNHFFKRVWALIRYGCNFFIEMARANLDVARRVIQPRIPLKPAIIAYPLKVKSRAARYLLANSITLTPGTLTVEERDDKLYIHCLDMGESKGRLIGRIKEKFENYLEEVFE